MDNVKKPKRLASPSQSQAWFERFIKLETEFHDYKLSQAEAVDDIHSEVVTSFAAYKEGLQKASDNLEKNSERITDLERWQNKLLGIGIVLMFLSAVSGALLEYVLMHH
jgi:hypothetical protein